MAFPTLDEELRQLEQRLLGSAVRNDPATLAELLTGDFIEFGSSGFRDS